MYVGQDFADADGLMLVNCLFVMQRTQIGPVKRAIVRLRAVSYMTLRTGMGPVVLFRMPDMATTANIHAPLGAVAVLRVVDTLLNAKAAFLEAREARITRRALYRLTDAQLADIGLTRDDIAKI